MIVMTLYTRHECRLCDEMERVLVEEAPRFGAKLKRVEIDGDAELESRFGLEVPVLFINQRKAFKFRLTRRDLKRRLRREVKR